MVGVHGSLAARRSMAVVFLGAHAERVAGEDSGAEALLVCSAVAALTSASPSRLCVGPAAGALPGLLGELRASGGAAYAPACTSGHGHSQSVLCAEIKGVGMAGKSDAALGVFVVGLAIFMWGAAIGWMRGMLIVGGLLMLGAVAATARQRRTGPDPEVTLRPGGKERPWRGSE